MSSHSYYHSSSVVFFAKLYHCFSFESGLRKIYCRDSFGHLDLKFPAALSVSAFLFPWQPATFWRGGDRFSTNQLPWGVCVSMSAKVSGKITTFWGFLWHGQLDLLKKEKQNDDDKVISAPQNFGSVFCSSLHHQVIQHSHSEATSRADVVTAVCETCVITGLERGDSSGKVGDLPIGWHFLPCGIHSQEP